MQDDAADHLHVVMSLAQRAPRRLAHGGVCFREDVVEARAAGDGEAEVFGLGEKIVVRQTLEPRLQSVDLIHQRPHLLDDALIRAAEQLGKGFEHGRNLPTCNGRLYYSVCGEGF